MEPHVLSRNEARRAVPFWGSVVVGAVAGMWLTHRFILFIRVRATESDGAQEPSRR